MRVDFVRHKVHLDAKPHYPIARRYNNPMTSSAPSRDLTFVLGGARSGKSAHAERLATDSGLPVTYIATARIGDAEFARASRIIASGVRRTGAARSAARSRGRALASMARDGHCVLIDCLTLWLANLLCPADDTEAHPAPTRKRFAAFDAALSDARGKIIIVSNEIGLGVVPLGSATRLYVDELGRLNQRVAALSTHVTHDGRRPAARAQNG